MSMADKLLQMRLNNIKAEEQPESLQDCSHINLENELREAFRGIRSMVEEDDKTTVEKCKKFSPSNMENVRNCPGKFHDYQEEALGLMVSDGQSAILVLPTGAGRTISKAEMFQTKVRGSNDQEYQLYLDHADNGEGGDITNNNLPLKSYDEWLSN